MALRLIVFTSALLLSQGFSNQCQGQSTRTVACAAFSTDGALATGTIRNGELETRLDEPDAPVVITQKYVGNPFGCEEAFSGDGRWMATVVASDELKVVIVDRKAGRIYRQFSSDWQGLHNLPLEPGYRSSFLGGFLPDDSLALWRYFPQAVADPSNASNVDLHLQRWSVEGLWLSDLNLGDTRAGIDGLEPIVANGLNLLWIPEQCVSRCYRGVSVSGARIAEAGCLTLPRNIAAAPVALPGDKGLLTIVGARTGQKARLLNSSGRSEAQVSLPSVPNFFGPLVPNWFDVFRPQISHDGEVAAIGRLRVAWVLVDTDRDWGSEIVLLRMHPLAVTTTLRTGKGGIGAIAVDHRYGIVRLIGFWKERWHDLQYDERNPGKWTEVKN